MRYWGTTPVQVLSWWPSTPCHHRVCCYCVGVVTAADHRPAPRVHGTDHRPWPAAQTLFDGGYSATDIITTLFRVVRNAELHEFVKLEYIKARTTALSQQLIPVLEVWIVDRVGAHPRTGLLFRVFACAPPGLGAAQMSVAL